MVNFQRINRRDMEWALLIRSGSRSAFTSLFETYYRPLCEYAFRFAGDSEWIEDVVQDVFIRIWEKRSSWSPKVAVRAYLYRSVYHQAINHQRKNRFEVPLNEELEYRLADISESPLKYMMDLEMSHIIRQVIDMLPERRREILVLRLLHELSYKEIGSVLGISVNTVDTQIRRAMKLLRSKLHPVARKTFLPGHEKLFITSNMPCSG